MNVKKPTQAPLRTPVSTAPGIPAAVPFGTYPERTVRTVPPPAELAHVPSSAAYCFSQLCLEIKYNLPYYLRKSDLMRFLRDRHDYWWARYTSLYERDAFTFPTTRTAHGWDYTNAAKEMLSRCKLFDSLFTQVLKLDLCHTGDFGTYCKLVLMEMNKLKPAFPDAPCSQQVFEASMKDIIKFVLQQAPPGFDAELVHLHRLSGPRPDASADLDDDDS